MTYEDCINDESIIEILDSINFKVAGVNYSVSTGDIFERLEVKKLVRFKQGKYTRKGCICECSCEEFIGPTRVNMLVTGELRSCGCYQMEVHSSLLKESNYRHGDSVRGKRSKLYIIWAAMIDRATNINRADSKYYADKGISVCEEWKDYTKFKEWALENGYQEGLSIDRKENSKGYEPSNCRWIPLKEQNSNKTSNVYLTYNGKKKTLAEWSRITGLSYSVLHNRIKKGLPVNEILDFK